MKTLLPLAALMLTASSMASAAEQCTDKPECWPEGSSMRELLLRGERVQRQDLELQARHEELVKLVGSATLRKGSIHVEPRLLDALRSQQQSWLNYRQEECELVGALTGAGGSWQSTHSAACVNKLTDQRLMVIRAAIRCVEGIPSEKRFGDQNSCLQQLAPLVYR